MTLSVVPNTPNSTQTLHPESLEGLIALREAGLVRHTVDEESQHQCAAWGSVVKCDTQGRVNYLDMGGCRLRKGLPEDVIQLFENQLQSIETLNLGGTDLPVVGAVLVLQALSNLKQVHLGANGYGDAGIQELASTWLSTASQLEILDLRYNDISGSGCKALCDSIQQQQPATSLAKLYLEGNRIQDEGASELAKLLEENSSLQEIFLGANSIGGVGAGQLSNCLRKNKVLSKIYLEGNHIGPDGAEAFTNVLLECKGDTSLKHLFVDNNDIGKEGSKRLAKALNSATAIGDSLLEG